MLKLLTALGTELPITWIGISELDGSLRFETTEPNMATLFSIFSDPEHTRTLTRVFDEDICKRSQNPLTIHFQRKLCIQNSGSM